LLDQHESDKLEELVKLKHAALSELERRGYDVRGKTPAQIKEILKRRLYSRLWYF